MVINQNEYLHLAGKGCLVLSHFLWRNTDSQKLFATQEIIERLVFLVDFNQLINESDPDASVESLQEISFFALLAVINHTNDNKNVASMYGEYNAIMTIIKQLKNGVFDPKKTACVCLSNLILDNPVNQDALLKAQGVNLLAELISDEEDDDELSQKAYKCLEYLGPQAISALIKTLQSILSTRDYNWNEKHSIIIDSLNEVERHLCTLKDLTSVPNIRDFGI